MENYYSIIPFAMGLYCGVYVLRTILRDRVIDTWPKTKGEILKSMVTCEEERSSHGGRMTMYEHFIEYQYEVDEVIYTSNDLGLVKTSASWESGARKSVQRYPAGKHFDVFYNPDDPEESYLEKDVGKFTYGLLIFIFLLLISVGIVILMKSGETG